MLCDKQSILRKLQRDYSFMGEINDCYHRTQRFRTTLANFHSYCQRQSEESSILFDPRSKSSCDIVNYKSIRQLRRRNDNKSEVLYHQARREIEPTRGEKLTIKNTDLIEIIKLKLQNNKMKTGFEDSGFKASKKRSFNQKGNASYQFCNQTSQNGKNVKEKKKRIDLVVSNTKFKFSLHPRTKREEKISELIVTLQNRPNTAKEDQNVNHRYPVTQYQSKYQGIEKIKRYATTRSVEKEQLIKSLSPNQKLKEISGWELPVQQEEDFYIEESRKRRKKTVR